MPPRRSAAAPTAVASKAATTTTTTNRSSAAAAATKITRRKVVDSESEPDSNSESGSDFDVDHDDDDHERPAKKTKGYSKPASAIKQQEAATSGGSANRRRSAGQKLSIVERPPPAAAAAAAAALLKAKALAAATAAGSGGGDASNVAAAGGGVSAMRQAMQASSSSSGAAAAGAAALAGVPVVSREVMNTNFEEWMKMATDNKITTANTWNFALIDYFADLTLLRNGPNDQSINFQKASVTLDGCVKIYNSRVDSVTTETGRLLSGLAGGGTGAEDEDGMGGMGEDAEDGQQEGEKKEKRKTQKSEQTLAKSFAALSVKKFDLEFAVDPLFKKTSADFDEGGATGLLMNHLGVDRTGRVVFDAGDVEIEDETTGEMDEQDEAIADEDDAELDLEPLQDFIPDLASLTSRNISVTLADFKFTADPSQAFDMAFLADRDDDDGGEDDDEPMAGPSSGGGPVADFFGDDDALAFDDGGGDGGFGDGGADDMDVDVDGSEGMFGAINGGGGSTVLAPFDPTRQLAGGGGTVMAMVGDKEGSSMMLDYFDQGFKNWAGPEHWKLRRVTKKTDTISAAPSGEIKQRKEKVAFAIDFESDDPSDMSGHFAPAAPGSIDLIDSRAPKKGKKKALMADEPKEDYLLPDDMHFTSRQLLTLFLKPKFFLKMRRQRTANDPLPLAEDGEVDGQFWAQAAQGGMDGGFDDYDDGSELRDSVDVVLRAEPSPPVPPSQPAFGSQFFHDDDAASLVDDALDMVEGDEDDMMAATQSQIRKIRPETVHYAKRAKRVDVKRLKDNIWKGLDIQLAVPELKSESEDDDGPKTPKADRRQSAAVAGVDGERVFDRVIENLRESYPQEKMSEISTSFCFICLLHLANEQGLKIEAARLDDGEGVTGNVGFAEGLKATGVGKDRGLGIDEGEDQVVGELQALKIYRDPDAGQAA